MEFAGIVYEFEEVVTPEATSEVPVRPFGLESSIQRSIVEGSEEWDVHSTVMDCVGSMLAPGLGEVMVRAVVEQRRMTRLASVYISLMSTTKDTEDVSLKVSRILAAARWEICTTAKHESHQRRHLMSRVPLQKCFVRKSLFFLLR